VHGANARVWLSTGLSVLVALKTRVEVISAASLMAASVCYPSLQHGKPADLDAPSDLRMVTISRGEYDDMVSSLCCCASSIVSP
jgi:hypothetical protein